RGMSDPARTRSQLIPGLQGADRGPDPEDHEGRGGSGGPAKWAEIMAEAILEGMQGELVLRSEEKDVTYANPLHAVKLYQDHMLKAKELALRRHRRAEADVVPSVRRNGGSSDRQPSGQVPGRRPESPPVHSPS